MTPTPNWQLPLLVEGGSNNAVFGNEALDILDIASHLSVKDRGLAAEPGSPSDGDAYILPASPSGTDWAGFAENDVAIYFTDYGWINRTPVEGWRAWVEDENLRVVFDGTSWIALVGLQRLSHPMLGILLNGEEDILYTQANWTISEVRTVITGSGTDVDWNLRFAADRSAAGTAVFGSTQTTTSKTTGDTHTATNDPTSGAFLWVEIISQSGNIDSFLINIEYTLS